MKSVGAFRLRKRSSGRSDCVVVGPFAVIQTKSAGKLNEVRLNVHSVASYRGMAVHGKLIGVSHATATKNGRLPSADPVCCVRRGPSEDQGVYTVGGMAAPGIMGVEHEGPWPSSRQMEVRGARMGRDAWKTPRWIPSRRSKMRSICCDDLDACKVKSQEDAAWFHYGPIYCAGLASPVLWHYTSWKTLRGVSKRSLFAARPKCEHVGLQLRLLVVTAEVGHCERQFLAAAGT
jgi:hypothetical protein